MAEVETSIDVDVPVRVAYNQWTQFEDFPQFMEGVKAVQQLDAKRLLWRASIGGKDVEWTAEITEQVPDQVIAWRSTSGARNHGTVRFAPQGSGETRVTLHLEYEPVGAMESTGSALGLVSARIEGDLKRYKGFIESRGRETGAWRGTVAGGEVQRPA
ncbi:MAG: SRPBCC family protein [Planctomycetota bacterium]|nr:MAG: SRPBCC family protein [Planctomycetota bacterium]